MSDDSRPPGTGPAVVVTRPDPDHASLLEALERRGLEGIHAPAYRLVARPAHELSEMLPALSDYDHVVVTSPFAARILARHANGLAMRRAIVVPGPGTAAILRDAGWDAVFPAQGGTSEDLLEMPELSAVSGRRVAIVAAPGGRTLLHRELETRGASVEPVYVYRREPEPVPKALMDRLADPSPPVVMVTSLKTAEALVGSVPEALRTRLNEARFIVSSERIAGWLREAGARRVSVARGASDEAMLEAFDAIGMGSRG